ncbi:MAG: YbdD/YjiX family protein [Methylotenera sp.]|uniref:YbdD/YjiX family protein n=1 Tax=Methylotenera sp. TaxID=2051956 RepID=UPI002489D5D5|nr:YbdD/YjiX family protein [Methylotenera sp.]MDI1309081.1 YbdD/YjiX family protein [Methylotenera sp.]
MLERLKAFWRTVRRLSGDDAYEQYLKHFAEHHADSLAEVQAPLSREAFFKEWQDKKWKGIKRCC